MIIKFFITKVLKWALSIDWKTFLQVLPILKDAAAHYPKPTDPSPQLNAQINTKRAVYATLEISKLPGLENKGGRGVNFLREIGLLWLGKGES